MNELFSCDTKRSFSINKTILKKYFEWCCHNKLVPEDCILKLETIQDIDIDNKNFIKTHFYYDLEEISNNLLQVYKQYRSSTIIKVEFFENIVVPTIYLGWLGFNLDEIMYITCDDVKENRITCPKTSRTIIVEDNKILQKLRTKKRGFLIYHNDNENIIRENYISQQLWRLSEFGVALNFKPFMFVKIRDSGQFFRIYQYEKNMRLLNSNDLELIKELTNNNRLRKNDINVYMKHYNDWKQYIAEARNN